MSEQIRVVVVDDHDTFRDPLAFMLEREHDLTLLAKPCPCRRPERRSTVPSSRWTWRCRPEPPRGSGADLIKELRASRPRQGAGLERQLRPEAPGRRDRVGAAGVMRKSAPMGELVEALRRLHAGEQLLSQEEVIGALRYLTRQRESNREAQLASERLTPREREVLQAIAEGSSDREIARRLHVGEGTVHSHVTNILSNCEVARRG